MIGRAAVAAMAVALFGCRPASAPAPSSGWVRLYSEAGGFSVRVPASDRAVTWTANPVGPLTQFDHEARDATGVYRVSWRRYPSAPPPGLLLEVRDELVASTRATLLDDRALDLAGFPARHLTLERRERDERVVGQVRLVLAHDRLLVLVFAPAAGDPDPAGREVFFGSLQFLPAGSARAAAEP